MKKHILILSILMTLSCKAQSVIVPIGSGEDFEKTPNYYKKDVNNEFDKFEGTWKYQNGNNEVTFKLKKEEHYQTSSESNYMDLLVGEYQYKEDGTEIVNTLSDFDDNSISGYEHNISGGVFVYRNITECIDNSNPNEIKIELMITVQKSYRSVSMITRRWLMMLMQESQYLTVIMS
ncbi:DUF6705 family protein [Winogradskyella sp.]|uniref:DUF6705 family protein n=1 Tax=Winogradskyella sp. TaxID=1883156 RepID=UPI003511BBCC